MTRPLPDRHEVAERTFAWARSGPQQILMVGMNQVTTVDEEVAWQ